MDYTLPHQIHNNYIAMVVVKWCDYLVDILVWLFQLQKCLLKTKV